MAAAPRITNVRINEAAALKATIGPQGKRALLEVGGGIRTVIRQVVPRSTGPGPHLVDNIDLTTKVTSTRQVLDVTANVKHATAYHNGSRPHRIFPKAGGVLRFYWTKAGRYWFGHWPPPRGAKVWANHPGFRGRPFFQIACQRLGLPYRPRNTNT